MTKPNKEWHPDRKRRRATIMILVLTVLAVCAVLGAASLKSIALQSRQARRAENESLVHSLAEAGLRRAAKHLATDPAYTGESWRLSTADLNADGDAVIELAVKTSVKGRVIHATARFPADAKSPVVVTRNNSVPNQK